MRPSSWPFERPILVVSSRPEDALVLRSALDRLGLPIAVAEDAVTAMQALCHQPAAFRGVVIGDRVGQVSGLSLCGVARDAGCELPIILMTADECSPIAMRAARLRVTILWHPISCPRLETVLRQLFAPRRQCMAS
jgi:CheY-like chemotaxis protein